MLGIKDELGERDSGIVANHIEASESVGTFADSLGLFKDGMSAVWVIGKANPVVVEDLDV